MRTPFRLPRGWVAVVALILTAPAADAGYTFQGISNQSLTNTAAGEAQLYMTVEAVGTTQVKFRFTNTGSVSMSLTDVYFDDDQLLDATSVAISQSSGVAFTLNDPPQPFPPTGGGIVNPDFTTTIQFTAPTTAGVNPGGWLELTFGLLGGQTYQDVIDALAAGAALDPNATSTAGTLRVGLLVQNFGDGESETFLNEASDGVEAVPAPPALLLVASAIPVLGLRRVLRRKVA